MSAIQSIRNFFAAGGRVEAADLDGRLRCDLGLADYCGAPEGALPRSGDALAAVIAQPFVRTGACGH